MQHHQAHMAEPLTSFSWTLCRRYLGVGSSNRKNQWQARILYHGKVTHLGYYRTEEEAARVYDKVSISLHGAGAQTNFPIDQVGFGAKEASAWWWVWVCVCMSYGA
jgi:hypothetical protein